MTEVARLGIGDTMLVQGIVCRPYKAEFTWGAHSEKSAHICAAWVDPTHRPAVMPEVSQGSSCTFQVGDDGVPAGWIVATAKVTVYHPKLARVSFHRDPAAEAPDPSLPGIDLDRDPDRVNEPRITVCLELLEPLVYERWMMDLQRDRENKRRFNEHLAEGDNP